jgi:hypothetical protein
MKTRILSIALISLMMLALLAGCVASKDPVYSGLGQVPTFRVGPGKDSADVPVYSFNYVTAAALFDKDGKIIQVTFDVLEVSSPNYKGASMPHFSGWPGTTGYNVTDHATGLVSGVSDNTKTNIENEINAWISKRERGVDYENESWGSQINFYQNYFKSKTVSDIEALFDKYFSDVDGRPLNAESTKEQDREKYAKLTDSEKEALPDIVSGATISLKDSHGDFISALRKAYENRVEVVGYNGK